jgi:hypothetical protein
MERMRAVEAAHPTCTALRCLLTLDEYASLPKHASGWIAERLGVSALEERQTLAAMKDAGMIRWQGERYRVVVADVDFSGDIARSGKVARYWTQRIPQRFDTPTGVPRTTPAGANAFAHVTAPVSKRTAVRIAELWTACYNEIIELVGNDQGPKERVQVVVFHSVDLKTLV